MAHQDLLQRAQAVPGVTTVALVLVLLTLVGVVAAKPLTRTVGRTIAFVGLLLGCTLTWWLVNRPLEGRVFVTVSHSHGFTFGDTLGLPAVAVSGILLLIALRRRLPINAAKSFS